ncbi:MAG: family 78 glycoside hydrolase catalytic domain [Lentisphaeria bacterium]|nr:family 78 glycoside hydrolase catalytic domain [Lentisphaeria bacterium]
MNSDIKKQDFLGFWLYFNREEAPRRASCIFLRKEFSLDSMISFADLRIAAVPGYHLYINGCHVGYDQGMTSGKNCRIDHYDVAQFLDIGVNTICVETFIPITGTCFTASGKPGVWCQLDLNNTPFLWTDPSWKMLQTDSCRKNPPAHHAGLGTSLQQDLAVLPVGWQNAGFDDSNWQQPDSASPFHEEQEKYSINDDQIFLWEEKELGKVLLAGSFREEMANCCLSFALPEDFSGGTYAAATYLYTEEEFDSDLIVSTDDPCVIYGNDLQIFSSGNRISSPPVIETGDSFKAGASLLQSSAFHLKKGWNKLLIILDALPHSMGVLLLFPGQKKSSFSFYSSPEKTAPRGWMLAGPLDMPFSFAMPSVDLSRKTQILPAEDSWVNDVSTLLHSCTFYPYDLFSSCPLPLDPASMPLPVPVTERTRLEHNTLREGEYAIYDLGKLTYGFPRFEFEGSPGDIVDITPGIHFAENRIRSVGPMGRKTDTVILSGKTMEKDLWHRFAPMGARYIMVTVRKAANTVTFNGSFHSGIADRDADIDFHCSDPLLEEVWHKALSASEQCIKNNIIDNPAGRCCQSLPECYIYARTLLTFFGTTSPVSNALQQFAHAQLPNGMIPAIAPSSIHYFAPDSALSWVLFLREYYMTNGNREMLEELLPTLEKLLDLFSISSARHNGLLSTEIFGKTEFLNESGNMEEEGLFTALNALYCRALLRSCNLFLAAGKKEKAEECRKKAGFIAESMQIFAFNEEKGLFSDNCLHQIPSENCSIETNILALYGGIVPQHAQQKLLEHILHTVKEMPERFSNSRILGFLLDTLCACGLQKEALEIIRDFAQYNKIYENLPTYENLLIFPLTAGNLLIREVLGLRPATAGRKQLYFNPACQCIRHAGGLVTNDSQQIHVEWTLDEQAHLTVKVDSNFPLELIPDIPDNVQDCTFQLGAQVNILQKTEEK